VAAGAHWAQKRARGRLKVREAAFALFAERGFEATTIEEIAARSGVSRRSIFRYFEGKEGIFFSAQHEHLDFFQARVAQDTARHPYLRVKAACVALAARFSLHRAAIKLHYDITQDARSLSPQDASLNRAWDDAMLAALAADPEQPSQEEALLAGALMGTLRVVLRGWIERGAHEDLQALGLGAFARLERGFDLAALGDLSAQKSPNR
jgi:AcrR family transcriptional regulator